MATTASSARRCARRLLERAGGCSRRWPAPGRRPPCPAAMIPGPAPVTTIQPRAASSAGEVAGLRVERVVGQGAGRAEDRHLGDVREGPEHREGGPHLLQRGGGDLQVEAVGVVAGQADGRAEDVAQQVAVRVRRRPRRAAPRCGRRRSRRGRSDPDGAAVERGALLEACGRAARPRPRKPSSSMPWPCDGAGGPGDVLVHQRAAEVVDAGLQHLARRRRGRASPTTPGCCRSSPR